MNKYKLYTKEIVRLLFIPLIALVEGTMLIYIFYHIGRGILNTDTVIETLLNEGNNIYINYVDCIFSVIVLLFFFNILKLILEAIKYLLKDEYSIYGDNTIYGDYTIIAVALLKVLGIIMHYSILLYLIKNFYVTASMETLYLQSYQGIVFNFSDILNVLYFGADKIIFIMGLVNIFLKVIFFVITLCTVIFTFYICKLMKNNIDFKELLVKKLELYKFKPKNSLKYRIIDEEISLEEALSKAFICNGNINMYLNNKQQTVKGISNKDEEIFYGPYKEGDELFLYHNILNKNIVIEFHKKLCVYKKSNKDFFVSAHGAYKFKLSVIISFLKKIIGVVWQELKRKLGSRKK